MKVLDASYPNDTHIPCSLFHPSQEADVTTSVEKVLPDWEPFTYKINEHGFRYDSTPKEKTICFVGCSITFGVGLSQNDIFPEIVTRGLGNNWHCINLGVPGSGPDMQIINLAWALDNFKIDKLVWYMSDPMRQMSCEKYLQLHGPNFVPSDRSQIAFMEHSILFEQTILLKTYWNLYSLFVLLKEKNIEVYFRCWIRDFHDKIKPLLEKFDFKERGNMKDIDLARDDMHKGILSHKQFAEHILGIINEN